MDEAAEIAGIYHKVARYIDVDVLTEAKKRIRHVLSIFDHVCVSFSGGKDSLVVLHLVREVMDEMGITKPLPCLFRDEELIPDNVIELVTRYYHMKDRFAMRYFAVPLASRRFILGENRPYIQWDPKREGHWVRPKPDFAIKSMGKAWDENPGSQHFMDLLCFQNIKGSVAAVTGVRAQESLMRLNSCLRKKNENYICATDTKKVKVVKPIFDWLEKDIFRYFFDRNITYAPIYDHELWAGAPLRVSTPLHDAAFSYLSRLKAMYPIFYQQLLQVFPDVATHTRYWDDFDQYAVMNRYPHTWEGILEYIDANVPEESRERARESVETIRRMRKNAERTNPEGRENFWGFPLLYVFRSIVAGKYMKNITPMDKGRITKQMLAYETGTAKAE